MQRARKLRATHLHDGEVVEQVGRWRCTPGLAQAFDHALALIGSALRDGRSQAAYLHGSFGGKSHFMAMLSLLVAGNEDAWRIPELHALRAKHGFVGTKNLLELQFHMIGQETLEGAIFTGYLAHLAKHHPTAPLPGVFADESLFENAQQGRPGVSLSCRRLADGHLEWTRR